MKRLFASLSLLYGLAPVLAGAAPPAGQGSLNLPNELCVQVLAVCSMNGAATDEQFSMRALAIADFLVAHGATPQPGVAALLQQALDDPIVLAAGTGETLLAQGSGGGPRDFCRNQYTSFLKSCGPGFGTPALCVDTAVYNLLVCENGFNGVRTVTGFDVCPDFVLQACRGAGTVETTCQCAQGGTIEVPFNPSLNLYHARITWKPGTCQTGSFEVYDGPNPKSTMALECPNVQDQLVRIDDPPAPGSVVHPPKVFRLEVDGNCTQTAGFLDRSWMYTVSFQ